MSRGSETYERLTLQMLVIDPACQNDDRFIADDQPEATLAPICRSCPLFDLCAEYAEIERPKAGVWAGKRYRTYKQVTS